MKHVLRPLVIGIAFAVVVIACSGSLPSSNGGPPDGGGSDIEGGPGDGPVGEGGATPSGSLGITLSKVAVSVVQGQSLSLSLTVTRPAGADGPIDIAVNGLP